MRGTVIPNGLMFYFSLLTRNFRAPSADRRETLPRDRKMAEWGSPSMGAKNMQNFGRFYRTSDFDRENLRNESIGNVVFPERFLSRSTNKGPVNFGPQITKNDM